eukprot:9823465-Lingulodinium_polyedra.AAC.1
MEVPMLCNRAYLHNCRLLFPAAAAEEKRAIRMTEKLEAMLRRNPAKTDGRNIFLADLLESAKKALGPGRVLSQGSRKHIWKHHASMYKGLTEEERQTYEARAIHMAEAKALTDHMEVAALEEKMKQEQELADEREDNTKDRLVPSNFRMSNDDHQ